jgi:hypothetical protein
MIIVLGLFGCIATTQYLCDDGKTIVSDVNACPDTTPAQQYLCEDGRTVVADLSTCPPYDEEYESCMQTSTETDYYSYSDRDVCFYNLALDRENVTLCKKIRATSDYYDYTAANCAAQIAYISNEPTLCDDVGAIAVADCYSALASFTEDPGMCDYISSTTKKDDCIYAYISSNLYYISEWSVCDALSQYSDNRDYCYYYAGITTENVSYCDKIVESGYYSYYDKSGCYGEVAEATDNPGLCALLETQTDRDDCYYSYATTYPYDTSVCNNIISSYYRENCLDYANHSYYY